MPTPEIIRLMTAYNYSYQQRLWDSIMTLTDEQFTAEIPYSHGSIRNHMVHLANVDAAWLRGLQEDPNARTYRHKPEDYPTREGARALCANAAAEVKTYIETLDEAALEYHPKGLPMNRWQVLLHLVNHGTDHRAQVLRALHDFGAPTFDQDLVYYMMSRE